MAISAEARRQIDARNAQIAKANAEQRARERAQTANYQKNQPIPLYGIGKGMDVYYRPGQKPGASRTEANGREISGYWDPRTGKYNPTNWTKPYVGNWVNEDGRSYYGGDPPDWMLSNYKNDGSMTAEERAKDLAAFRRNPGGQGVVPGYGSSANMGPRPPGSVPLPPGQGPVIPGAAPPPQGQQGNPYIGLPPPNQPPPGAGGNKVPGSMPSWYHVQQDPMAQQQALANALRTG